MPDSQALLVELLKRSADGDEVAFARLYDATRRRIFGLTLRILREPEAAEEAALAAYWSLWSHAVSYDPERGSPMAWILTIARSKAIDLLRSRARSAFSRHELEADDAIEGPAPDPEAISSQAERCRQVRSALASLPREQRLAIETAYFAGLSYSEVAATLGQPLGTVKSRIRLGLSSLRRALAEVG